MPRVIAREHWGAPASRAHLPDLAGSHGFGLHYNGPALDLPDHSRCDDAVRATRRFHVTVRGWLDIAYSFLVCPHGAVYEGRGWGKRTAANGTNDGNSWGLAVMCLLGEGQQPTRDMLDAVAWLCGKHDGRYGRVDVRPHSSFKATGCPGDPLRRYAESGGWRDWKKGTDVDLSDRDVERIAAAVAKRIFDEPIKVFAGPDKGEVFDFQQMTRRMYQQQGWQYGALRELLEELRGYQVG